MGYPTDQDFEEARQHRAPPRTAAQQERQWPFTAEQAAAGVDERKPEKECARDADGKLMCIHIDILHNLFTALKIVNPGQDLAYDIIEQGVRKKLELLAMTVEERVKAGS